MSEKKNMIALAIEHGLTDEEISRQVEAMFAYRVLRILQDEKKNELITILEWQDQEMTLMVRPGDWTHLFGALHQAEKLVASMDAEELPPNHLN